MKRAWHGSLDGLFKLILTWVSDRDGATTVVKLRGDEDMCSSNQRLGPLVENGLVSSLRGPSPSTHG